MKRMANFRAIGGDDLHGEHLVNRRRVIGRIVDNIASLITTALLKPPGSGAQYHDIGF